LCKACLQEKWRHKGPRKWPVCRKIFKKYNPLCNLVVKNLCDAFLQERSRSASETAGSGVFCSLHREEKLMLFCVEGKQLICVVSDLEPT
jgi:tripartite motif-containing protein 35